MITRGARDFASRDWKAVRESKEAYWAERIARFGPLEGFRIADELRRQVLLYDPSWPDAAARESDFLMHERVSRLLRRAGAARGR